MPENKEKTMVEQLTEELLIRRRNGFMRVTDAEIETADAFCEGYKTYLDAAKTEREAVTAAIRLAEQAGFTPYETGKTYRAGDRIYVNNRGKALMLAVIGKTGCRDGVRLVAAHIDAPRLDLKPIPLYETSDLVLFKTHYYGGIKKYQWTAVPLSMHGRVVRRDGSMLDLCIGEAPGEPQFCITDLLPHLSQEQAQKTVAKAVAGEDLNILIGSRPVRSDKGEMLFKLNIMKLLHEKYGIVEQDLISAEIEFVPAAHAVDLGLDRSMVGAYGHDDRVCAYPAIRAALDCGIPEQTAITVLADKEETGSDGNTGLNSAFLRYFIKDLAQTEGLEVRHVLSKSKCLSADVTAAYDPTYASAYEAANACYVNNGVGMSKYTGARGKGGTSDASAEYVGEIRALFDRNSVLWQIGELGRVDLGGGGTVAMYVANLNVDVLDVGVPVLSMHAPFEVVAKLDVYMAYKAFRVFYREGE